MVPIETFVYDGRGLLIAKYNPTPDRRLGGAVITPNTTLHLLHLGCRGQTGYKA